jgi:hypothetical protein
MTEPAAKSMTVGGGMMRLALGGLVGALTGAAALFAWLETHPDPHALFGGTFYHLLVGLLAGGFLGLFIGGAAGWVWLVVAVGRESRKRATVAHNHPPEAESREETHRGS